MAGGGVVDFALDACGVEDAGSTTQRGSLVGCEVLCLRRHGRFVCGVTRVSVSLRGKGDAVIVTDVKVDNMKALRKILEDFKEMQTHIIPQVYSYQEYLAVDAMGYRDIILTLYRMRIDPYEVIAFSRRHSPFAITMPWQVAQSGLAQALRQNNTPVYAHTVNDIELFDSLRKMGVLGIYTDYLFQ